MQEYQIIGSGSAHCLRHKREKVTHICTDPKCFNNPLLCSQCFNENINLSYHYDHESSVLGMAEAIERISSNIKSQIAPVSKFYKSTLGRSEYVNLLQQIEKGPQIYEELQDRINTIKSQVELELDLLIKDFQKVLLIEKQEYFKLLDTYQRGYTKNMDYIKAQVQPLLDFHNSIKYYGNQNNLYMKVISEAKKKTDWLTKAKRSMQSLLKMTESNSSYNSELNNLISSANRIKLDIWPAWKGEEMMDKGNDLKYIIKRSMSQWAYIPELKVLGESGEPHPNGSTANLSKNYYSTSSGK